MCMKLWLVKKDVVDWRAAFLLENDCSEFTKGKPLWSFSNMPLFRDPAALMNRISVRDIRTLELVGNLRSCTNHVYKPVLILRLDLIDMMHTGSSVYYPRVGSRYMSTIWTDTRIKRMKKQNEQSRSAGFEYYWYKRFREMTLPHRKYGRIVKESISSDTNGSKGHALHSACNDIEIKLRLVLPWAAESQDSYSDAN